MSKQNAIIQPLGLATILALGFGTVIGLIVLWITILSEQEKARYEYLMVLADGTPAIRQWERYYYVSEVRTLDGQKVPAEKYDASLWCGDLAGPKDLELKSAPYLPVRFPLQAEDRIQQFSDCLAPPTYWYFIGDGNLQGRGYFIGFDSKSKQCIGYLGTQGFRSEVPEVENWFPMDGRKMDRPSGARASFCPGDISSYEPSDYAPGRYLSRRFKNVAMISGDRLLLIDLRERSIATRMKSADLISLSLVEAARPLHDEYFLIVRTTESVVLFDVGGKQLRSYVIPEDLRDKTFSFYDVGDEKAMISWFRRYPDFQRGEQLTWLDTSGKILRREEVVLAGRGGPPPKADVWKGASAVPEPITLIVGTTIFGPISYLESEEETTYAAALSRSLQEIWQPLVAVCILAAVLAWFCYRRQRRMALPWTWVWVAFVFLCGVPGFLGYLFHRRWPVMENCPACGKDVPHDRETCSSCGSEFPRPELKGIEVFA